MDRQWLDLGPGRLYSLISYLRASLLVFVLDRLAVPRPSRGLVFHLLSYCIFSPPFEFVVMRQQQLDLRRYCVYRSLVEIEIVKRQLPTDETISTIRVLLDSLSLIRRLCWVNGGLMLFGNGGLSIKRHIEHVEIIVLVPPLQALEDFKLLIAPGQYLGISHSPHDCWLFKFSCNFALCFSQETINCHLVVCLHASRRQP